MPPPWCSQAASGTWRKENGGTRQRLYDVACLSVLRCEAVGAAGTIVSTVNGGRTWRAQANPLRGSSKALYQITCVAPSSCYVIARPDTILVTHDGGRTWSRHVLPVGVAGSSLTDRSCLANYTPIAGRPALCRLGLLDSACVSARVCSAVATAPPAYAVTPVPKAPHAAPGSIWMTRDGGASWIRQSVPPGVACNGDCTSGRYGYPLVWVTCLSSGLCRAGGGHVLGCGHCGFAYAVLVTRGPGRPWACVQSAATCTTLSPDAGDCPACYVAGSHGTVARITNGSAVTAQRTPTARDLYGIGCSRPATCYAVGDNGTILALG